MTGVLFDIKKYENETKPISKINLNNIITYSLIIRKPIQGTMITLRFSLQHP